MRRFDGNFQAKSVFVLAGSASFLYPALVLGAVGGIMALGNIAPEQCYGIYRYTQEGRHEEARQLQLRMIPPTLP